MGNYASQADLKARYEDDVAVAHLTLDEETGTPNTAVLDEVIDDAEGEINSYLAARYLVPVDVSSDTGLAARLKSLTLDLATYKLELRTGHVTDERGKAHDDGIAYLDKISKGAVFLPAAAAPASTASRAEVARFGTAGTSDSSNRLFTRATQAKL